MTENLGKYSKRQRLFDLVKTTKDVYIPTLSNTISQLASEATSRALNYNEGDEFEPSRDYKGANIVLYPHFTRESHDDDDGHLKFYTQVHGWVYSTEGSHRKKTIVLSLARRLARSNNYDTSEVMATQIDEQLNSINDSSNSDSNSVPSSASSSSAPVSPLKRAETTSSSTSEFSSASTRSETDDILKERIASFVNRSLGNLELKVAVGGETREDLKTVKILTDNNGNFNIDVTTEFRPSYIQVAVSLDEKIFVFKETIFIGKSKFGVISDIDDTIKRTGVCGDKRTLFRNTFAEQMSSWEIPGAADCYRYFEQTYGLSYFYVSNSPYQLYSSLVSFFEMFSFPKGSMYLKKYSGNILNSVLEPSHTRKKEPLERIMKHFTDKKFFLIGDTSEQDLEAYVDIARLYPQNVAGIYLRVADVSMSVDTFKVLKDIIDKRVATENITKTQEIGDNLIDLDEGNTDHIKQIVSESEKKSNDVVENLIDLESGSETEFFAHNETLAKKIPPKVPKKPTFLKSSISNNSTTAVTNKSLENGIKTSRELPPLPKRPIPTPPPRHYNNKSISAPPTFSSGYDPTLTNEQTDDWTGRLLTSLIVLRKVGDIKLKIFVEFEEIQTDIRDILDRSSSKND